MSDYGVKPTGFVRKPLSVILAEIEEAMITEFGTEVIQTSQSPFGQLNGVFAELTSKNWELAEDVYQSYDPDQSEGNRLDILGRLRLLERGILDDIQYRKAITNQGESRVDLQDISRAIGSVEGVTYKRVFVNETGEIDNLVFEKGTLAICVIGGDDEELAAVIRKYVVPGVNTYGNHSISSNVDGFCRSLYIIRPIIIEPEIEIRVKTNSDNQDCPPPSAIAIRAAFVEDWNESKYNGKDVNNFTIRSLVESRFSNVEVASYRSSRDGAALQYNLPVEIGFIEMAEFTEDNVSVTIL